MRFSGQPPRPPHSASTHTRHLRLLLSEPGFCVQNTGRVVTHFVCGGGCPLRVWLVPPAGKNGWYISFLAWMSSSSAIVRQQSIAAGVVPQSSWSFRPTAPASIICGTNQNNTRGRKARSGATKHVPYQVPGNPPHHRVHRRKRGVILNQLLSPAAPNSLGQGSVQLSAPSQKRGTTLVRKKARTYYLLLKRSLRFRSVFFVAPRKHKTPHPFSPFHSKG